MLQDQGFPFCRLDGQMKANEQDDSLETFSSSPTKNILLASILAAGTGLNITCAQFAFIMVGILLACDSGLSIDLLVVPHLETGSLLESCY